VVYNVIHPYYLAKSSTGYFRKRMVTRGSRGRNRSKKLLQGLKREPYRTTAGGGAEAVPGATQRDSDWRYSHRFRGHE